MTGYLIVDEIINAPAGRPARRRSKPPKPLPPPKIQQFAEWFDKPVYIGQNIYIRPNYIVSVPEFSFSNKYTSRAFRENQKNLKNNSHNGILSDKSTGKIRNAVNWLVHSAQPKRVYSKKENKNFTFKVGFITLTLPDTEHKISSVDLQTKLLNPFLVYFRKYSALKNYVWKLEYQDNGKLHVHLTVDTFIHWQDIRKRWNHLLNKNGWLEFHKAKFNGCSFEKYKSILGEENIAKMKDPYRAWLAGSANGWSDPNTTDVHAVHKIKDIAAYISKYMSKNPNADTSFKGRIWGCSYELSKANKTCMHVPASELEENFSQLMRKEIKYDKIIQCNVQKKKEVCVGEIFILKKTNWQKHITGDLKAHYLHAIESLTNPVKYFEVNSLNSC